MSDIDEPQPPAQILARIPDPWFKVIDCGPGWYPLIEELDEKLAAIDPDYQVHQCKQKFGALRYYAHTTVEDQELRRFRDLIAYAEIRSAFISETTGAPAAPMVQNHWHFAGDPTTAPADAEFVPPATAWMLERLEVEDSPDFAMGAAERLALEVEGWFKVVVHLRETLLAERRQGSVEP